MSDKTDHLAVLFADIVESTALYRSLGDVEALRVVSACLGALKALLPRHRGRLVKLLGDAVMCLFPDADCAVEAAMAMQREVAGLRPGGLDLQIRIDCTPARRWSGARMFMVTRSMWRPTSPTRPRRGRS
ncbi:MAG: adenylate/guanylate cyclase domain-containing protein [Burkholderiales bacterium]|nr:adenylate/guanylate cyclase domain-containing protein [Burkholderiales bacterium]